MRPLVRILILILLLVSAWSVWTILRPYDTHAEKNSPWKILAVSVKRDHSFYWIRCRLKSTPGTPLPREIKLHNNIRAIRSADYYRMDDHSDHISFWVGERDLQSMCRIEIDGTFLLLKNEGTFSLNDQQQTSRRSPNWK